MVSARQEMLSHWGRVTHICASKLTTIGSDNGLSPGRRQAIIWTNSLILFTHWGRVTHISVSDLTIIGSDNGLSPGRHQAIIRTNAGILLLRPLGTNFSEILTEIIYYSFKKMRLKVSSAKRRPFCLGLNVLTDPFGTNFNEMLIEIHTFSFKKMHLKMSSGKWRPFCFDLNVLRVYFVLW